jgi:hypothetical protein
VLPPSPPPPRDPASEPPPRARHRARDAYHTGATADVPAADVPTSPADRYPDLAPTRYVPLTGDAYDAPAAPGDGYRDDPYADPYGDAPTAYPPAYPPAYDAPPDRPRGPSPRHLVHPRHRPRYDLEATGVDAGLVAYVVGVALLVVLVLVVLPLVLA